MAWLDDQLEFRWADISPRRKFALTSDGLSKCSKFSRMAALDARQRRYLNLNRFDVICQWQNDDARFNWAERDPARPLGTERHGSQTWRFLGASNQPSSPTGAMRRDLPIMMRSQNYLKLLFYSMRGAGVSAVKSYYCLSNGPTWDREATTFPRNQTQSLFLPNRID
jgi:hypothetical protein